MLKRVNLIGIEGKMNTFFFTGIHFRIEWNSRGRQFNSVQLHQISRVRSDTNPFFLCAVMECGGCIAVAYEDTAFFSSFSAEKRFG